MHGYPFLHFQCDVLKDNPNPEWPPVTMTSNKLCNGDYERPLKVEIWDYDDSGKHDFIGEYFTNVTEVILVSLIIYHNLKNFLLVSKTEMKGQSPKKTSLEVFCRQ